MITLDDLFPEGALEAELREGYVRAQTHPTLPLRIFNYAEKTAYDARWNDVTRTCRGLIVNDETGEIVARPFPKFFNYGQPGAPDVPLDEPVLVTEKIDGSLGILYPTGIGTWAVATRGSFTSEQAVHATEVWADRYANYWKPRGDCTYLYEIVYPGNRIVVDYGDEDDLYLLACISVPDGHPAQPGHWPGPNVRAYSYDTLADALRADPRPNAEGLVCWLPTRNERVKIKQDDYVALHRILTGTNARHVWEVAAVRACHVYIRDRKHWGSFLGIDPARAEEVLELGDDWLADVPDEFYAWIRDVTAAAEETANDGVQLACRGVMNARNETTRQAIYRALDGNPFQMEAMRYISAADGSPARENAWERIVLKAWRLASPEPTAPFARSEDVS